LADLSHRKRGVPSTPTRSAIRPVGGRRRGGTRCATGLLGGPGQRGPGPPARRDRQDQRTSAAVIERVASPRPRALQGRTAPAVHWCPMARARGRRLARWNRRHTTEKCGVTLAKPRAALRSDRRSNRPPRGAFREGGGGTLLAAGHKARTLYCSIGHTTPGSRSEPVGGGLRHDEEPAGDPVHPESLPNVFRQGSRSSHHGSRHGAEDPSDRTVPRSTSKGQRKRPTST